MQKKALILDLDNTIYLVSSIGDILFKSLFELIELSSEFTGSLNDIKAEIMRRPFQFVANDFAFSNELKEAGIKLLERLTYPDQIRPVENYEIIRTIPATKFLVTTGFTTLQNSKIDQLGIRNDFEEIHIIDPGKTAQTKRDVFKKILIKYKLKLNEVLVVGDDLNSEIKAAKELGIETVLYDFKSVYTETNDQKVIRNFSELSAYFK
jgi:putative hydrolase of the HAD superfamily